MSIGNRLPLIALDQDLKWLDNYSRYECNEAVYHDFVIDVWLNPRRASFSCMSSLLPME
jgi:hypothetical protein